MPSGKFVQTLLAAVLVFGLFNALQASAIGRILIGLFVMVALVVGVTLWLLKYDTAKLLKAYQVPAGRRLIDTVCQASGEQPPSAAQRTENFDPFEHYLRLRTPEDLRALHEHLSNYVRGQNHAIGAILQHLATGITTRRRTTLREGLPPLACFLLAGPEGCGKRHLAQLAAWGIFSSDSVLPLDFGEMGASPESLLQQMVETARLHPFSCFILENVSKAGPASQHVLEAVLAHGSPLTTPSGAKVGMQNCVWFFIEPIDAARARKMSQKNLLLPPAHELADAIAWSRGLLDAVGRTVVCTPLSEAVAPEVVFLLLRDACSKYQRELNSADPDVVVELARFALDEGPSRAQTALVNVVRRAVEEAAARGLHGVHVGQQHLSHAG